MNNAIDLPLLLRLFSPLAVIAMAIPACGLLRSAWRGWRHPRDHCQRCGFPRSSSSDRVCPECGASAVDAMRRVGPIARCVAAVLALVMFAPALASTPRLISWLLERRAVVERFPDTRMRALLWLDAPALDRLRLDLDSTAKLQPSTLLQLTRLAFERAQVPPSPVDATQPGRESIAQQLFVWATQAPAPRLAGDLGVMFPMQALDEARRGAILDGYLQAVSSLQAFDSSALATSIAQTCWNRPVTINGNTAARASNTPFADLTAAQISRVANAILDRQADPGKAWPEEWGAAFEGLASRGRIADDLVKRYRENAAALHIRLPRTPLYAGEATPAMLDYEIRAGGRLAYSGQFVPDAVCADLVHLGKDWKWPVAPPAYPEMVIVLTPKSPGRLVISGTAILKILPDDEGADPRLANVGETTMRFWLPQAPTTIRQHISVQCEVLPARTLRATPQAAEPAAANPR